VIGNTIRHITPDVAWIGGFAAGHGQEYGLTAKKTFANDTVNRFCGCAECIP
jgi:hypothetical protein